MGSTVRNLASKVFLLLIGVLAAVGIAAFSPSNAYAAEYDIYVGGVQVTDDNMDDVLGDGRVSYTSYGSTGTLTLYNASIPMAYNTSTDASAIYVGDDISSLTIYLFGDNDFYMPEDEPNSEYYQGIAYYAEGDLQISGQSSASLTMDLCDYRPEGESIYGIYCSDSQLRIFDVDIEMNLEATYGVYGIYLYNSCSFVRADVVINGVSESFLRGVICNLGGDLWVTASRLAVGSNMDVMTDQDSRGIECGEMKLLEGSDVSVQMPESENEDLINTAIEADTISVEGGSSVHAFAGWSDYSYGIDLLSDSQENLYVENHSYLEACGYTSAFGDALYVSESTEQSGAKVNKKATPEGATDWDHYTDWREYRYVCIPGAPSVSYRSGVEGSTSWQGWKYDGAMSGTSGQSLRMEGLQIELENACFDGGIEYKSQLQSDGWEKEWRQDGQTSGYAPDNSKGKRLEAVQIQLYGEMAEHFDVWYHLQVQRFGWMGWVKNGETAGSVGYGFRVEAIEIVLTPKGVTPPSVGHSVATPEANMLSFVRCRSYDNKTWQSAKGEGDVSGTRNQTKTQVRVGLAASSFNAAGIDKGNSVVQVRVYQDGKWSGWSSEDDAYVGKASGGPIRGIQARLKSGSTLTSNYDLYYRVEVKDGKNACWLGWAKNGETAGQSNINLEQIQFSLVKKGNPAPPANSDELKKTTEHSKQRWVIERWPCNWPKPAYRF